MMYAKDWHKCVTCGCTRPEHALIKGVEQDIVKGEGVPIYACFDVYVCKRMKEAIEERDNAVMVLTGKRPKRKRRAA